MEFMCVYSYLEWFFRTGFSVMCLMEPARVRGPGIKARAMLMFILVIDRGDANNTVFAQIVLLFVFLGLFLWPFLQQAININEFLPISQDWGGAGRVRAH